MAFVARVFALFRKLADVDWASITSSAPFLKWDGATDKIVGAPTPETNVGAGGAGRVVTGNADGTLSALPPVRWLNNKLQFHTVNPNNGTAGGFEMGAITDYANPNSNSFQIKPIGNSVRLFIGSPDTTTELNLSYCIPLTTSGLTIGNGVIIAPNQPISSFGGGFQLSDGRVGLINNPYGHCIDMNAQYGRAVPFRFNASDTASVYGFADDNLSALTAYASPYDGTATCTEAAKIGGVGLLGGVPQYGVQGWDFFSRDGSKGLTGTFNGLIFKNGLLVGTA